MKISSNADISRPNQAILTRKPQNNYLRVIKVKSFKKIIQQDRQVQPPSGVGGPHLPVLLGNFFKNFNFYHAQVLILRPYSQNGFNCDQIC